jgi:hypothetical protein
MTARSGSVHPVSNTVECNAAGTAAGGISQLENNAIYD